MLWDKLGRNEADRGAAVFPEPHPEAEHDPRRFLPGLGHSVAIGQERSYWAGAESEVIELAIPGESAHREFEARSGYDVTTGCFSSSHIPSWPEPRRDRLAIPRTAHPRSS